MVHYLFHVEGGSGGIKHYLNAMGVCMIYTQGGQITQLYIFFIQRKVRYSFHSHTKIDCQNKFTFTSE